jgi:hypothetical protein
MFLENIIFACQNKYINFFAFFGFNSMYIFGKTNFNLRFFHSRLTDFGGRPFMPFTTVSGFKRTKFIGFLTNIQYRSLYHDVMYLFLATMNYWESFSFAHHSFALCGGGVGGEGLTGIRATHKSFLENGVSSPEKNARSDRYASLSNENE